MSIAFQQDEEILKVFQHGRYIGYVGADHTLYMIDADGYAIIWRGVESRAQIAGFVKEWQTKTIRPEDIMSMLLTLVPADKINHYAVKQAKQYMMEMVKR